ncbi:hypothetical protein FO059_18005 (plasmid) [Tomitella fengzijianii]|uniref:Uncharacterized protein n=1 Tax=Tomitella fengzijianii TaxID=2597660 RepID=A0A516X8U6_9ACTN|nr:hypothetical protein [Tomitella fengzijianii]QDQ99494.1 hypothetical protein FO059_18005 [Tomitella fengzijianii]
MMSNIATLLVAAAVSLVVAGVFEKRNRKQRRRGEQVREHDHKLPRLATIVAALCFGAAALGVASTVAGVA